MTIHATCCVRRLVSAALSMAYGILAAGCGTTYTAAVLDEVKKAPSTGVRYYLPQDVLQVSVHLQTRTPIKIRRCDPAKFEKDKTEKKCTAGKWIVDPQPAVIEPVEVSVDLMTVADTEHALLVDTNSVAFGKSDSTITVSEHGLLQSVNAKTVGTAGTVIQNLMKLAATASSLSAFNIGASVPSTAKNKHGGNQELTADRPSLLPTLATASGFGLIRTTLQTPPRGEPDSVPQDADVPGAAAETTPPVEVAVPPPVATTPAAPTSEDVAKEFDSKSYLPVDKVLRSNSFTISDLTLNALRQQTAIFDPARVNLEAGKPKGSIENPADELKRCVSSPASARDKTGTEDDVFMERYVSSAEALRLGFQNLEEEVRKRHRLNVCNSLRALDESTRRLTNAQGELARADSREKIYVATRKIDALRREYNAFLASASAASSDLKIAAEAKAREAGFGAQPQIKTKKYQITLRTLLHSRWLESLEATEFEDFRKLVSDRSGGNPGMFTEAALVFSVDDIQAMKVPEKERAHLYSSIPANCGEGASAKAKPCIYHRIARPVRITAWTIGKKKRTDIPAEVHYLVPVSSRVVDIVDDDSIVQAIDLHSSAWTKRDFSVSFTPQGRLVSVKRDYGSAAEEASAAFQQGLSTALTQYQTGLASVKSIRESENALELMPLQQQLALGQARGTLQLLPLQQQLAIAQAQGSLALQPLQQQLALANANSSLSIQPVNAQLAEAQAQLNLLRAQASLQAGQAGFAASVQAQISELERILVNAQQQLLASQAALGAQQFNSESVLLQGEIARMRNEIDLIKLRKDLEDLKDN